MCDNTKHDAASPAMIEAGLAVWVEGYSPNRQGTEECYDRMRLVARAEEEERNSISPELRAWLDKSTVSSFNEEKFIVTGNMLRIEDFEGNVIEERPLKGREGQLLGTMIFLQHERETTARRMVSPTQDDIFERGIQLVEEATKCNTLLSINNGNVHVGPLATKVDEVIPNLTDKARQSTFFKLPDGRLFRSEAYDSSLGFLHAKDDTTGHLVHFHIESELKDAKFFKLQPF